MGLRSLVGAAMAMLTLAACGTVVYGNEFTVSVTDASSPAPVRVAIFDNRMGDTADWARDHMGTTSPGQPYVTTVSANTTRMIGDNSLPQTVDVGLYLPEEDKTGYYALNLTPVADTTVEVKAPFVTYDDSWQYDGSPRPTGPPLPVTVSYREGDNGWLIDVRIPEPGARTGATG